VRTIIRFSLNSDNGSLTKRLGNIFKQGGFGKGKRTGTYEHPRIGPRKLGRILREFWSTFATHRGKVTLDHFWMYTDKR